jgi:CPA2 family monovalent cation:H+ antiporter-2
VRATRQIVGLCRRTNPQATIIARTRYAVEISRLYEQGANEVVPEEFETSVEIFTRVMRHYLVPEDEIDRVVADVRSDTYQIFRSPFQSAMKWKCLVEGLSDLNLSTMAVEPGSEVVGKSIAEIDIRGRLGISVLLVRRGKEILRNPAPDLVLKSEDVAVLFGDQEKLIEAGGMFQTPQEVSS